jgi:atypical dual specificity phosphatase
MTQEKPLEKIKPPSQFDRAMSLLQTGPRALVLRFVDQFRRKQTGAPVWDLSRITPQVYVGGQHYPKGWQAMLDEGISAVINMREAHLDDVPKGIGGEHHLHCVTRDNTPPTLEDLHSVADFTHEHVEAGLNFYIHCGVGVGRAPSAAAEYFIKHQNMNADEALAFIRKTRPFIHLTYRQQQQLHHFADDVRR